MQSNGSARELIRRWKGGDHQAAENLYTRYSARLRRLVEGAISDGLRRRVMPEDILQSTFQVFFLRAARGDFNFEDSGAVWRLLAAIARNTVRHQARFHQSKKRDVRKEVYPDQCPQVAPDLEAVTDRLREGTASEGPRICDGMSPRDLLILRLLSEGHSVAETATAARCSRWTVRRVLDKIGARLSEDAENTQAE